MAPSGFLVNNFGVLVLLFVWWNHYCENIGKFEQLERATEKQLLSPKTIAGVLFHKFFKTKVKL